MCAKFKIEDWWENLIYQMCKEHLNYSDADCQKAVLHCRASKENRSNEQRPFVRAVCSARRRVLAEAILEREGLNSLIDSYKTGTDEYSRPEDALTAHQQRQRVAEDQTYHPYPPATT